MKKIEAFISPARFDDILAGLIAIGAEGLTMTEVKTRADKPHLIRYRSGTSEITLDSQLKLEIVVADFKASQVVESIRRTGRNGNHGNDRILIVPLDEVMRIRTGECGEDAL